MADARNEFMMHLVHELPAPRPLIFRMQTEPPELARWWGPNGFTAPAPPTSDGGGGLDPDGLTAPATPPAEIGGGWDPNG